MSDKIKFNVTVLGDEHYARKLDYMAIRSGSMEPVMRRIGDSLQSIIEEQFATEGARGGKKWDKLSLSTAIARKDGGHPILIRTGDLLIRVTDPDVIRTDDTGVTLVVPTSERVKAEAHQYGFTNSVTGQRVPARPWMVLKPSDKGRYTRWIKKFLVEGDVR